MINIVTEQGSWILKRMANELASHNGWKVSTLTDPKSNNYYMNYALAVGSIPCNGFKAGYFTHKEPDKLSEWQEAERVCKYGIYMANRYKPNCEKTAKIFPTGLHNTTRPLTVGFVGRLYSSGRKGEAEIKRVIEASNDLLQGIRFKALGNDSWNKLGVKWEEWQSDEQARNWYNSIDVLYVASRLEGGPVPVMEAVKLGKDVIVGDIGNIEEWKELVYIGNSEIERVKHLYSLWHKRKRRIDLCNKDWKWFADEHKEILENGI